jgi:hypothetical protein
LQDIGAASAKGSTATVKGGGKAMRRLSVYNKILVENIGETSAKAVWQAIKTIGVKGND